MLTILIALTKEEIKKFVRGSSPELVTQIEFTEWTPAFETFKVCRVERR
jgi:hypothetical protein